MSVDMQTESLVLGGGCFWCTEAVFLALRGVLSVTPGYSGGHTGNPSYEEVCSGESGHVEVVRVVYDPAVIGAATVLRVFFATHDPTSLNRQGADAGSQYASVVYYANEAQKACAQEVMHDVQGLLDRQVVTRLEPLGTFWPAEDYHHDYYARHPLQGYCQIVIAPKLAKLRQGFEPLLAR